MYLCGRHVQRLDSLWRDYQTYHFSYPVIYTTERDLAFDCRSDSNSNNTTPYTVEFRKISVPPANYFGATDDNVQYKAARGSHKFKLLVVRLCAIA